MSGPSKKKPRMRTAADVIKRLLWDASLPEEGFSVGYLDRFVGVLEEPFNADDAVWQDVPEHRIQWFRYRGVPIWQKDVRLDLVFGTAGGAGRTLPGVVSAIDAKRDAEEAEAAQRTELGAAARAEGGSGPEEEAEEHEAAAATAAAATAAAAAPAAVAPAAVLVAAKRPPFAAGKGRVADASSPRGGSTACSDDGSVSRLSEDDAATRHALRRAAPTASPFAPGLSRERSASDPGSSVAAPPSLPVADAASKPLGQRQRRTRARPAPGAAALDSRPAAALTAAEPAGSPAVPRQTFMLGVPLRSRPGDSASGSHCRESRWVLPLVRGSLALAASPDAAACASGDAPPMDPATARALASLASPLALLAPPTVPLCLGGAGVLPTFRRSKVSVRPHAGVAAIAARADAALSEAGWTVQPRTEDGVLMAELLPEEASPVGSPVLPSAEAALRIGFASAESPADLASTGVVVECLQLYRLPACDA